MKVYQIKPLAFLFKLRLKNGLKANLVVELGRRIHITRVKRDLEPIRSSYVKLLKDALRNALVLDIEQVDTDRIVVLRLRKGKKEYRLVLELFSGGAMLLLDEEGRIEHVVKKPGIRVKELKKGEKYELKAKRDPAELSAEEFLSMARKTKKDLVRFLVIEVGLASELAEEACAAAGVNKNADPKELSDSELLSVLEAVKNLILSVKSGSLKPTLYVEDGDYVAFSPIPLRVYSGYKSKSYKTFNELLDDYFSTIEARELASPVQAEIEKLKLVLKQQEEHARKLEEASRKYREVANAILANLNPLNQLLRALKQMREELGDWNSVQRAIGELKEKGIAPYTAVESINPNKAELLVKLNGKSVKLDFRISPSSNAQRYFELAKEYAEKAKGALRAKEGVEKRIKELEQKFVEKVEKLPILLKRRAWYERFRHFFSSEGFLVLAGLDASQNEVLVKKYMEKDDIFMHADIHGAPVVIIKCEGRTPGQQTLLEAAVFAASYSKAWREGLAGVDVYWVYADQVSKTPPSGMYLPKGSFMVRGRRNYVKNVPLKLAIGLVKENSFLKLVSGPVSAVENQTDNYVIVVPGTKRREDAVEKIKELLSKNLEDREKKIVQRIDASEFLLLLPLGGIRIVEKRG